MISNKKDVLATLMNTAFAIDINSGKLEVNAHCFKEDYGKSFEKLYRILRL